jgi:hypothetical protein
VPCRGWRRPRLQAAAPETSPDPATIFITRPFQASSSNTCHFSNSDLLNFQQRLSLRPPHCINPSFFQIATFRPISIPVDRDFESSPRTNASSSTLLSESSAAQLLQLVRPSIDAQFPLPENLQLSTQLIEAIFHYGIRRRLPRDLSPQPDARHPRLNHPTRPLETEQRPLKQHQCSGLPNVPLAEDKNLRFLRCKPWHFARTYGSPPFPNPLNRSFFLYKY